MQYDFGMTKGQQIFTANIRANSFLLSSLNRGIISDTLKYGDHMITMICNNLYVLYRIIMFYLVSHTHLTHLLVENVSNPLTEDEP